ncbi:ROK family transcriptional regulator [Agromyces cerinus]|uniref:Sugar kinase of the NBD/HSP70 family, may contain an N-terminal HTH domain n=1 Tax=Agromyces cerinus subsp. cerinus TaxID=232089 RepID=A0A1N6GGF0_9MICO|nr:ROK family transcriptional regulator [Agromyces cerinus]SIO06541.1 Sugar kinase of the NBD/HSP70 family, may contain an N-terminal HTH domain [Agromyces cerinus subsp. cerinus]
MLRLPRSLVSGDVRRHNLALVLEHLVRAGPSARSEIAEATGLTRGAVTALVAALSEAGVLRETDPVATGTGRPMARLELAASDIAVLVAQVDADTASALLTTLAGDELFRASARHGRPMGDPDAVLDVLAEVVAEALDAASDLGRRVVEMPVVVFAPVGGEPPVVLADTDLGWGEVDVLGGLRSRLPSLPGSMNLESDAWLAAVAERAILASTEHLLYIKSNSGIGGAILSNGRLVGGAHGVGGALGHIVIVPDGELCDCGQRGCLVTVAGPDVLLERAGLADLVAERGLAAAVDELSSQITAGGTPAAAAWADALPWIARSLQVLSMATDPEAIVIGGFWAEHTASIEHAFRSNRPTLAMSRGGAPAIPAVVAGQLGADAALLGAAWAARDRLLAAPDRLGV